MNTARHTQSIYLPTENDTLEVGQRLAFHASTPLLVFLEGDLGAGKTTLVRGFLQGLGYKSVVKSPTYTLVETYSIQSMCLYHFDLYRLSYPEELEFMGMREYFSADAMIFIEWPEKGEGFLPEPDLVLRLMNHLEVGRMLTIQSFSQISL